MNCREATEFIMDYLSGQLDDDIVARFERHISRCDGCRAYLSNYKATLALEREAFASEPAAEAVPEELILAILQARRP
jgi:anti-sigma factor RsiW